METHLLKKTLRSRKAISPILATLLLIVIAVSAIVITYAWVTTFLTGATGQDVRLTKINVYYDDTQVVIDLKNMGTSDGKIDSVYIGESSTALVNQTSITYNPSSRIVPAQGASTIRITVTYGTTVGTRYYFKINPEVGAYLEFNEVRSG